MKKDKILKRDALFSKSIYISLFSIFLITSCITKEKETYSTLNNITEESNFIGNKSCKNCHEQEFESWENSHHDQAMKIANSTTILANFNNVSFTHNNVKSNFFIKENDFYVNTEGPDGKYYDYKIVYTFGFTPLQQYIIQFPNGEYQCLLTAWDSVKNKWFHLQPNLEIKHNEWLHWTGASMKWNTMCADCHSTNLEKNYDSKTEVYSTSYSEINVSCEACHGPSSSHVNFYEAKIEGKKPPKMEMPNFMTSKEVVDKCARCHSRRSQFTKKFDYTSEFLDHYSPSLLIDPIYELDGQIKDEDYVYGSFIQSKMYHNGISCKDCHDVHSLKLKKTGNDLCLNCHVPKYNTAEHHFHKEKSEGAQCINCHMPGKFYMGNDFRRDHSFRVPRPDQTVKYNVPNACNTCHKDKSAKWASEFVKENYGSERTDHFSDHLLKGYFEDNIGFKEVFTNKKHPNIARATAINQYQITSKKEIEELIAYLKDSSALVRSEVIASIEKLGVDNHYSKNIAPLLNDSIRNVRITAARYFNMVGEDMGLHTNFKKADKEYLEALDMNSDFASGQHQIALYHQTKGDTILEIKAYRKALEIDNYYNMSRMNLAFLYYQQGNIKECEKLYLKVIEQEPEFGSSYYMLGLLYNETGNIKKAIQFLDAACKKEPVNLTAFYNYALILQKEGENKKAISIINEGLKLAPNSEKLLYVKLIGQLNLNLSNQAKQTCKLLINLAPNNRNYKQILTSLE
ncbi:MAG: tetratricopeptide repeat protein [Lutibacter sp.]|uniref:multiheme c-type cytochrome n=1 Tax=Lutibacter sp. TaxID=1925666 RepID=UPI0019E70D6A|nr:multiheme c-type cytochrome [Lutibacter sp.]NOR28568.1 tetratricopeptide repeat protein [Lutibacter sp.]